MKKVSLRSYYRYVFVIVVFLCTLNLPFFGIQVNWLKIPVLLLGFVLLIYELCKGKLEFKTYHLWLLLGFVFCLFLATQANGEYASKQSYVTVGLQLVIFFLIFGNEKDKQLIQVKREMRTINQITCVLTFCASSISLLMFLCNMTITRNGTTIGLLGNRLFGIYFNANPAAFLACMSIVFSVLLIRNKNKYSFFYFINIIVQFIFVLLTNCRAALIILAAMMIMVLYYTIFKRKQFGKVKKIMFACLAAISFYFASDVTQRILYIIPQLQGAKVEEVSGRFQLDRILDAARLIKEDAWGNRGEIYTILDDVSSKRLSLWNASYKVWKTSPIIGIGEDTLKPMVLDLYPEVDIFQEPQVVHTHNFFMEAMVTAGIIGFVLFLLFFLNSMIVLIEVTRKYSYTKSYFIILMSIVVLMSEFVGGFLDYGVFYTYSLSATLFWIYLGYLHWINQMPRLKLVQDHMAYDFISYDLEAIDYSRSSKSDIVKLYLNVKEEGFIERAVYMICIGVNIEFETEETSMFQYRAYFDVEENDDEVLKEYEDEMILEVYEIVRSDIEVLISDSRGKVELPMLQGAIQNYNEM